MGFFSSLREKFRGKKVEQNTVLPTLQDINKENNDLNKIETNTVENIINAPPAPPQTNALEETYPSMGPSPEGVILPVIEQQTAAPKKKAKKKKIVKKATPVKKKTVAKKKAVKKAAPKRKKAAVKKKASKKPVKKKGKKKR
jgi:hypothetical protein